MAKLKRKRPSLSCDACTACCTVMRVTDLPADKPNWTPCPYLCARGCAIYDGRPPSCQAFHCVWLQNGFQGDPAKRPDQLGVMFTVSDAENVLGHSVLVAWEVWPGGFRHAQAMLDAMATVDVVVLKTPTGMTVRGPEALVAEVQAKLPGAGAAPR